MLENKLDKYYSPGEVDELLSRIDEAEINRVILAIEYLNPDRAGLTGQKLYEIAIEKMLADIRHWKRGVPFGKFVYNTARSTISSEVNKKKDMLGIATAVEYIDELGNEELTAELENDKDAISTAVKELIALFDGDNAIMCIILNTLKNKTTKQIKAACKMAETVYRTAVRRMQRTARINFPTGFDYWRNEG